MVQDCALGCLLSGDIGTCGSDCMSENTDPSDGCAGCFGEVIACTAANALFSVSTPIANPARIAANPTAMMISKLVLASLHDSIGTSCYNK